MDLGLSGKNVLITGSTAGIGAATARHFAQEGARTIVHGRDAARAEALIGEILAAGGSARAVLGDLSTDTEAEAVFQQASEAFGGIDILVNNAGDYIAKEWFDTSPSSWEHFFNTDMLSAVRMIHQAVKSMRTRGWGRIINIASGLATTPQTTMPDYAAAKAALLNSTVSLARALAGTGITSNTISPGVIHTDSVERVLRETAERLSWGEDWETIQKNWFEQILNDKTVHRLGRPEEVAAVIAFVASPRSDYINGANIRIDGGKSPSIN